MNRVEKKWREYEIERWRSALLQRGLRLKSLDPEYQRAIFETIWSAIRARHRTVFTRPDFERRRRRTARALLMAALVSIGYGASFIVPSLGSWVNPPTGHTTRSWTKKGAHQDCSLGFVDGRTPNMGMPLQIQCGPASP